MTLNIKKNNYGFNVTFTIYKADGTLKTITGLVGTLKVYNSDTNVIEFSKTLTNAGSSQFTWSVVSTETDTNGVFYAEISMTATSYVEDTDTFLISISSIA